MRISAAQSRSGSSLAELFAPPRAGIKWNVPSVEPVHVWAKPKSNFQYRAICDFGPKNRTMHYALRKIREVYFVPRPFQYDVGREEGYGLSRAIKRVKSELLEGNVWAATLDIKSFHPSFEEKELYEILLLPKKVIANIAVGTHLNIILSDTVPWAITDIIMDQARRGGPQGSALSPLIGSMIISRLNWSSALPMFNWVDNFLILGPTKEAVTAAAKAPG